MIGINLKDSRILLSTFTPDWHTSILRNLFGLTENNFIFYNPSEEHVLIKNALIPHLLLTLNGFHEDAHKIFNQLKAKIILGDREDSFPASRVVLVNRRGFLNPDSHQRRSTNFDDLVSALLLVYPQLCIVDPGRLSLRQQVEIFDSACLVIGEYGSALHNTIFSREGATVFAIGNLNDIQEKICQLRNQKYHFVECDLSSEYVIPVEQVVDALRNISILP